MRFTLYPYPPVRALSPPGGSVFTRFVVRSERVAELDPPYAQVIFVRLRDGDVAVDTHGNRLAVQIHDMAGKPWPAR